MRILVVGAGALGGLVGAYLTRAGQDVTLLEVNQARAKLLNEAGLLVARVKEEEIAVAVRAVTLIDQQAPFDLVFVAVKTYQTDAAVRGVLRAVGPGTRFLSMQNGLGNAETIAAIVGAERVLCGITYHSVQHAGPNRLQYRPGIKPIQIAPFSGELTPDIQNIGDVFRTAGLDTDVVTNIDHAVWQKLLHNAVVNPVSALTGLTCREILADEDLLGFMRELSAEIIAVMRARGVPIVDEADPFRPIMGSLKALGKNRPSMWQDLSRGARTEVDALNGAILAEAVRLGLAAPHNAAIVRFIHSRERQKFLNRQAIAAQLGLERRADGARERPRPIVRATPKDADGGLPHGGPPLESTRKLKELIHGHYVDLTSATDDPDRLVAACSALGPVEVLRALDMAVYIPQNHAALLSASRQADRFIARASAEGYSQFSSSGMRADIGALLEGSSPLVTAHGLPGPPRPDVAVYSTNMGHELMPWFEFYGAHYGIPVVGLHPPPGLYELDAADIDAASGQMLRLVAELQRSTGRTMDIDRLAETVGLSAKAGALWEEILGLCRSTPAPITFFDMLIHMAPMVLLRGTPEAVHYYRLLKSEIEERLARGVAAVAGESHRFYWDGPPVWCALRPLSRLFMEAGVAIVASTFCAAFGLGDLEPNDPFGSMARVYTGVFGNRSEAYKSAYLAAKFEEFGIDGVVYHDCRTTAEASHVRYGLADRTQRLTGVPALVFEADSHDLRLFSTDRLEGLLTELLEQRVERHGV
jgi:2-dehydropantoate 2-reductase